jgi:hypothetical protein
VVVYLQLNKKKSQVVVYLQLNKKRRKPRVKSVTLKLNRVRKSRLLFIFFFFFKGAGKVHEKSCQQKIENIGKSSQTYGA